MIKTLDLLVIGAGQAGLAAGYYAKQKGLDYLIVDSANCIGDSWRNRYDSLILFTPRSYSSLPGLEMPGDKEGYPAKGEVANYLEAYTSRFNLNIELKSKVIHLTKENSIFTVQTDTKRYFAKAVIVATGPFQLPAIPKWSDPTADITQIHSTDYRNSSQIKGNKVLVVGDGNSGVQIATELVNKHDVDLSSRGKLRFIPTHLLGKNIFWWLDKLGILFALKNSLRSKLLVNRSDPIVGTEIKSLINNGSVRLRPAAVAMKNNQIQFSDGTHDQYDTIIWSTGYKSDYNFIDMPRALDDSGSPLQDEGLSTTIEGLGFLGLKWLRTNGSALVGGVGRDAKEVIKKIHPIER